MLLIEHDKRNSEWAAQLAYSSPEDPKFYVPENVYVIGMMNTADRSLSLVDYALRRRFAFVTLEPQFDSSVFKSKLRSHDISDLVIERISERMGDLNAQIAADTINLGRGFRIGHSFFVPDKAVADSAEWHRQVIQTEVCPLLEEYWLDDIDKVTSLSAALLQDTIQ
jgi:5-methylcytosine-specific restriction endonuclease McrBC GTP-binding regulatory subunit McrB